MRAVRPIRIRHAARSGGRRRPSPRKRASYVAAISLSTYICDATTPPTAIYLMLRVGTLTESGSAFDASMGALDPFRLSAAIFSKSPWTTDNAARFTASLTDHSPMAIARFAPTTAAKFRISSWVCCSTDIMGARARIAAAVCVAQYALQCWAQS